MKQNIIFLLFILLLTACGGMPDAAPASSTDGPEAAEEITKSDVDH